VDARLLYERQPRGIGKTLLSLYRHLAGLRPSWTFLMCYQVGNGHDPLSGRGNVVARQVDGKGDRFHAWEHVWFPLSARLSGADVLHCHSGAAPVLPLCRTVATVHDLIPLELQPKHPGVRRWVKRIGRGARLARRVLTPSQFTRKEIHRILGVPLSKITVVHWGPNEACLTAPDAVAVTDYGMRYGMESNRPYVLHFGMPDPRKNTRRVLEAWAQLPASIRGNYALLVVGIQGPALEEFRTLADELGLAGSAFLHGYVPEDDLPFLLRGAAVLCYPSQSEGFGLPVIDAFACGTAVLTSNTTSLPEVAGDAALLIDPASTEAVRDGLQRLLTDVQLRNELAARGRERLQRFSWVRCAEQVADVFADCAR
jgi:alpha-1,3-rhamnosyl/mannosyltransferase